MPLHLGTSRKQNEADFKYSSKYAFLSRIKGIKVEKLAFFFDFL